LCPGTDLIHFFQFIHPHTENEKHALPGVSPETFIPFVPFVTTVRTTSREKSAAAGESSVTATGTPPQERTETAGDTKGRGDMEMYPAKEKGPQNAPEGRKFL
jgi:hypothetical protein